MHMTFELYWPRKETLNSVNHQGSNFSRVTSTSSFARFSCCTLTASTSATVPWLRPLWLLLPVCVCFSYCSKNCICFSCCSPIASLSPAASWLRPLQQLLPDCARFSCYSPIESASVPLPDCICLWSRAHSTKVARYQLVRPRTSHFRNTHTHIHTHICN